MLRQEYAYVWNQGPNSRARTHLVTDEALDHGRLRRAPGDALCKPRSKFWGLSSSCASVPVDRLCRRCVALAQRLGLPIPADPAPTPKERNENDHVDEQRRQQSRR